MSILQLSYTYPSGQKLEIVQGDITRESVDAIVNAANSHLQHGAGVAGAILRRGGYQIQQESLEWVRQHGQVKNAEPAYTGAGKLPCRYVIHAVGPVWGEGDEDAKLSSAIRGSLQVADRLELASIAFPAISTGIFGFPKDRAARIFLETLQGYFTDNPSSGLKLVRLTLYDRPSLAIFLDEAARMGIPPADA
ncbi:MAG: macro domain-containing protein [Anaerolineaceae bacterium]|nr:macro domain-containing protein [Anaerolineaceae bacterium]